MLPQFRRRGIARALLKAVAQLALSSGRSRRDLDDDAVERWRRGSSTPRLGAEIEEGICYCRLHGEALERLAQ